jgi:hypothetical protein
MNQDLAVFITPFGFLVACALIAGGMLYFIDIKFLRSQAQAIGALVAGAAILGALELVLAGSSTGFFKAQQVQTSECELQGESAHPEARLGADAEIIRKHIVACMKEAGYEWSAEHRHCKEASVATNAYCYLPIDGFDRAITSMQLSFE